VSAGAQSGAGVRALAGLLVVQALLALWTWWPSDRSDLVPRPLLDLEAEQIDALAIARRPAEGEEPDWLRLERTDGGWVIASEMGYPADPARVEQLLDRLLGMRVRSPIATTAPSHNALSVGEQEYGRRVRIEAGDRERELVVGAARSDSVNVRFADETDVYLASGVSEFSLSDTPSSYWSRDYVSTSTDEIESFVVENQHGRITASRTDDGWRIAEADGREADLRAVEDFLDEVGTLRLAEPVSPAVRPEHGLDGSTRIAWTLAADDQTVGGGYVVGRVEGGHAYVKADTVPFVVKVTATAVEPLRTASAARLLAPGAAVDDEDGEPAEPVR